MALLPNFGQHQYRYENSDRIWNNLARAGACLSVRLFNPRRITHPRFDKARLRGLPLETSRKPIPQRKRYIS
ncbi:protein of unknown function [Rhodovastum atsumiense]|nr:protein of unknown function [Rhodovastum atsumiense]